MKALSVRAIMVLQREFGHVPKPAAMAKALREHRFARLQNGWPPYKVLRGLKGCGIKTVNEIADYGRIRRTP